MVRDHVSIVGPTAAYPFMARIVEHFGDTTPFKYPAIETIDAEGAVRFFCARIDYAFPDVLFMTGAMGDDAVALCRDNGIGDIVAIRLGYEALALVRPATAPRGFDLAAWQLFLAVAAGVPGIPKGRAVAGVSSGILLVANPYGRWIGIAPALPDRRIAVLLPARMTAEHEILQSRFLVRGCRAISALAAIEREDPQRFAAICAERRRDGAVREVGDTKRDLVGLLEAEPDAVGIMPYTAAAADARVSMLRLDGVLPSERTIRSGAYRVAWPLYVYIKRRHFDFVPGLRYFAAEIEAEADAGYGGLLAPLGLVPASGSAD